MSYNNLLFMFWKLVIKSVSCFICIWNIQYFWMYMTLNVFLCVNQTTPNTTWKRSGRPKKKKCNCAAFVFLLSPVCPTSVLVLGSAPQRWSVDGVSAAEPHSWPVVCSICPGVPAAPLLVRLHLHARANKSQSVLLCACVFIDGVLLVILQLSRIFFFCLFV